MTRALVSWIWVLVGACGAAAAGPAIVVGTAPGAIVIHVQSVDGEAQFRDEPGLAAVAYVQVQNRVARVMDVDVSCRVEHGPAMAARVADLAVGETRLVYLSVPIAQATRLPVGAMTNVACGTRLAGSRGPYVLTRADAVAFSRYVAPDLAWRRDGAPLDVVDCDTRAVPVAGRDVCVDAFLDRPIGLSSEVAQALRVAVSCNGVGVETGATGGKISLRLPGLRAPGEVRCTLDAGGRIAERDERNNTTRTRVPLLASTRAWRYGAAIRAVAPAAAWRPGSDENGMPPWYELGITVANTGAHPWRDVRVTCTGNGVAFAGGGTTTFPEHAVGPGVLTLGLRSRESRLPPGRLALVCTLEVTSPTIGLAPVSTAVVVDVPPPPR